MSSQKQPSDIELKNLKSNPKGSSDKDAKKAKGDKEEVAVAQQPKIDIKTLYDLKKYKDNYTVVVKDLCERYPEIVWLTSKTNVTPEGIVSNKDQKLSVQMFGETHIEFDKTIVSIFCLLWLMNGDYPEFVACQPPAAKLTEKSFNDLRNYVKEIAHSDDARKVASSYKQKNAGNHEIQSRTDDDLAESLAIEALVVFTVLNDLGKVESVVQLVRSKTAVEEVDHDKILWMGLKTHPALFPSFLSLHNSYKQWLLNGLGAQFNFAQLVQGESVPASLNGLKGLDKMSLDLFNLHALFDMAGAAGHVKYNGSVVLTEATYNDMFKTIKSMEAIARGATVSEVYDSYLHERGKELALDIHHPTQRAILRICCNLRFHDKNQAKVVIQAYEKLPKEVWFSLRKELCTTGVDDSFAILLYYAPALLLNYQAAVKATADKPNADAIEKALRTMAECFKVAREHIKTRKGSGVFTGDIAEIASLSKTIPDTLPKAKFVLNAVGEDGKISAKFDEESSYK